MCVCVGDSKFQPCPHVYFLGSGAQSGMFIGGKDNKKPEQESETLSVISGLQPGQNDGH